MFSFFAKLHPLIVHFPVGLLVSGALFELYGRLRNEEAAAVAGGFNVRLGFWCALPVLLVGLLGLLGLDPPGPSRPFLRGHILSAFTTVLVFSIALGISRFRPRPWARVLYLVFLGLGLVGILSTGYFGGELVHRFGISTPRPVD